ncbi:MAG: thioredoxin domain-containing protein [Bacteroidales bacterium]|nr:thioredoxin domain-containing protein [Bacteroidales bacterium]
MNKRAITLLLSSLFFYFFINAQNSNTPADTSKVNWKSFEEVQKLFAEKQKPVYIFLYDNKDSSQLMLNQTFGLDEVANYINVLFYPIKLNIYSKDTIRFFDGQYYTNQGKNIHDLAFKLAGDTIPYTPTSVVFSREAVGAVYKYYKNRDSIFPILIYYAEDANKALPYPDFEKYYFKTYPPGRKQIMSRVLVKWKPIEEAFETAKKTHKKIFVNLYNNYNISCTMMRLKTYNNPVIAKYLNEKFIPVNIDVKMKDTVQLFGQTFINENQSHGYHQLAISFLNGKMVFPAFLVFDENGKFMDKKQEYMTPETFEPLIHFVGDDAYKTQKWTDYLKNFKGSFEEEEKTETKK